MLALEKGSRKRSRHGALARLAPAARSDGAEACPWKREKVVGLPRLFSPGTQALSVTVIVASVAGSAVAHAPSENSVKVTFSCRAGPSVALTEPTLDAMKPGTAAGTSAEHVP